MENPGEGLFWVKYTWREKEETLGGSSEEMNVLIYLRVQTKGNICPSMKYSILLNFMFLIKMWIYEKYISNHFI